MGVTAKTFVDYQRHAIQEQHFQLKKVQFC